MSGVMGPQNPRPAPAGQYFDPISGTYKSIAGSPQDVLDQRRRQQQIQDEQRARQAVLDDQARQRYQDELGHQRYVDNENRNRENRNNSRQDNFDTYLRNALNGLTGNGGNAGGGGGGDTYVPPPSVTFGGVDNGMVEGIDTAATASQNSAFASAKAKAGAMARASLDSLRGEMADRGIVGGGTEANGLVDRLAEATNPLSDVNNQALHENVENARQNASAKNHANEVAFNGSIAQRGQDVGARTAAANRNAQSRQTALTGLLNALGRY